MPDPALPTPRPSATDVALGRSQKRVTDAERERAANRIRSAYELGALGEDELEQRLSLALSARTRSDLVLVTRDLPRDRTWRDAAARAGLRWHAVTYVTVNGGLVATWLATGGPFWPAGSIAPWGTALALHAYAARGALRRGRRRRR